MKVGIIGSRKYSNEERIEKIVFSLLKQYKKNLIICSGGAKGADNIAKNVALKNNINYIEFAPSHFNWNKYCYNSKEYFNKKYSINNFWKRNKDLIDYTELILAFVIKNVSAKGTLGTIDIAKKLNKKYIIFEDDK